MVVEENEDESLGAKKRMTRHAWLTWVGPPPWYLLSTQVLNCVFFGAKKSFENKKK